MEERKIVTLEENKDNKDDKNNKDNKNSNMIIFNLDNQRINKVNSKIPSTSTFFKKTIK
jgi:hypothetical protein